MPNPDSAAGPAATLRPFACSSTIGGLDAAWVHVAGALDIATSPELDRALREAPARLVVLDLRDLAFMDSAGIDTIREASAGARRDGRTLILLRGTPNVDRLFAFTGTDDDVEVGDLDLLEPPVQPLRLFADEALVP